ncbi:hypothetical protein HN992_03100 [Candidatus Woesearchaeota archaeon]|jgi:uncharacterized protein (UPF0332 family)|nr:hypothetical protein [Candidatus Woesearchaeota archaeon]MBT3438954.1 hypothetical protein [Candidatus Woesearchaeota archaeon]MBT4057955.1 hypothetical protein [Candidatus Woesearchaeota archaeon]MBT4206874.1 hypothetical protein [Candidatus Woesearchaeota archaeon]MBT4733334.1 hypothetical protein [Candidatus Woesearchaeota archaeon]
MKEASWEECVEYNSAKKVSPNLERADSLRGVAEERIGIIKEITLKNCNFVFEDYYTSLLELLQALIIQRGYKILNHICLGYFLRDVLKEDRLYNLFDDLRYKRNSLTYYGNKMDFETAKQSIENSKTLMKELEFYLK